MIIIDKALEKLEAENKPVRVGMVGAGFQGRGVALEIIKYTKGMKLVAISNRTLEKAKSVYNQAGVENVKAVNSVKELEETIINNEHAITENAFLLCESKNIDVIVDVTGALEFGAQVTMKAIENKKHVVTMNAELDGTVGSIIKHYADKNGVMYTVADGDQPGVTMNLYRFVKGLGVKPVLAGNIKGLHDPYRNPTTQKAFAEKWGQNPYMVTSFADGTKISFEQAIIANATGMKVGKRGMYGPTVEAGTPVNQTADLYPIEKMLEGEGIVDYIVGAVPAPGVWIFGTCDDPVQKHYLNLYKLGEGPLYCFYVPYHLCHFEVPNSIARAVIFNDATLAPIKPYVDVITAAKTDIKKGQTLDGLGGYLTYGLCENTEIARKENLLPLGLAEGCKLKRDVSKDEVLTFDDVEFPEERLIDKLWKEQLEKFGNG